MQKGPRWVSGEQIGARARRRAQHVGATLTSHRDGDVWALGKLCLRRGEFVEQGAELRRIDGLGQLLKGHGDLLERHRRSATRRDECVTQMPKAAPHEDLGIQSKELRWAALVSDHDNALASKSVEMGPRGRDGVRDGDCGSE